MPSEADSAVTAKRALRAEFRERRRIRPRHERELAESRLTEQLISLTQALTPDRISCYLSTVDEPPTRAFLLWADGQGIETLVPISRDDGLLDWALFTPETPADERRDAAGMPVPGSEALCPLAINEVGLILVPAAAVDRTGVRMGWGRGYFDKTLGSMERRPPVFAVVFDDEIVDELPREAHDEPVDGAVTPSGVIRFPH
jgi:5-formyltetrahydrofolate cyclo-ligase